MKTERSPKADDLAAQVAQFYEDPLGFVLFAFPWGMKGTPLENATGPRRWQWEFLEWWGEEIRKRGFDGINPVDVIQASTVSGHGIGKSALTSWIILFISSTRPHSKGVVTANTSEQLKTKTWGELGKWHKLCVTGNWFDYNNSKGNMNLAHKKFAETWRCDAQTCREENSESFAGLHAATSTPYYIFDEASAVPDKIFEVSEGGLTDGEPMRFLFGNGTRNTGYFHRTHHRLKHRFRTWKIDSRDVQGTNKDLFERWAEDWGDDSDFFKVRVRGMFPNASSLQFIPGGDVERAQNDNDVIYTVHDPIIMGVDVARFGDDQSVIYTRIGRDGASIPPKKFRGLDTIQLAQRVIEAAEEVNKFLNRPVDAIFVDGGGVGGGVVDQLRALHVNVIEVNFGSKSGNVRYNNKRAEMWGNMKEWLQTGRIVNDPELYDDLTGVEYGFTISDNKIQLEKKEDMKKRGLASPDMGDALALTFAFPIGAIQVAGARDLQEAQFVEHDYDPYND